MGMYEEYAMKEKVLEKQAKRVAKQEAIAAAKTAAEALSNKKSSKGKDSNTAPNQPSKGTKPTKQAGKNKDSKLRKRTQPTTVIEVEAPTAKPDRLSLQEQQDNFFYLNEQLEALRAELGVAAERLQKTKEQYAPDAASEAW